MATFVPPSSRKPRVARHSQNQRRRSTLVSTHRSFEARGTIIQPSRFRLILVWGILILAGLGLALRLFWLQAVQAPTLKERARQQQQVNVQPYVPRRPIVDRLGNVVAMDQPTYTLYVHPLYFKKKPEEVATALAPILQRQPVEIASQFFQRETGIRMASPLSQDKADRIRDLQLDGLDLVQQPQRFYPQNDLFADVVGYVDADRQGQAGVELSQSQLLKLPDQTEVQLARAGDGTPIANQLPDTLVHQDDVRLELSLDSRLQRIARSELKQQVEQFGAKRGAVMVMDASNGEMLALVSEPSYDPNQYFKFDVDRFRNWVVSDLVEPGSTFKPINVAIALDAGVITPNQVFEDEGRIAVNEWPIENYDYKERGGRGPQAVSDILKHSSNVGMVHIIQQLKPSVYYEWLQRIGLGDITGTDLPSEAASQLKTFEQFTQTSVERATAAFGQGFSMTPIQLLQLHGAIANGGNLVTPHVVRGLFHADGKADWLPTELHTRQIFSPQTAQTVLSMMEGVVADGTGEPAQIQGYRIAGKTGTAQKAGDGGYYEHARVTSFVSIFPADAPRYVVLVVIDEPQGDDAYGSTVSAPLAKAMMEALITIENIPPSQPIDQQQVSATENND
jgi:cell division protein FtsI (penicillin-binding protein 3)